MDNYGIGAAIRAASLTYFSTARRMGRTTQMIDSLRDGDVIVFAERREADRVKRLCMDRGLVDVKTVVVDPKHPLDPETGMHHPTHEGGRRVLDHLWVEQFYLNALSNAEAFLDRYQWEGDDKPPTPRPSLKQPKFWL